MDIGNRPKETTDRAWELYRGVMRTLVETGHLGVKDMIIPMMRDYEEVHTIELADGLVVAQYHMLSLTTAIIVALHALVITMMDYLSPQVSDEDFEKGVELLAKEYEDLKQTMKEVEEFDAKVMLAGADGEVC